MQIMLPSNLTGLIQSADYRKIDGGKIWFGKPNQDPQSYPADVWLDKAMTIPAPPFFWLKMGYLSHNGNIVDVYVADEAVSILITDAYNRQLAYLSNVGAGCPKAKPTVLASHLYPYSVKDSYTVGANIAYLELYDKVVSQSHSESLYPSVVVSELVLYDKVFDYKDKHPDKYFVNKVDIQSLILYDKVFDYNDKYPDSYAVNGADIVNLTLFDKIATHHQPTDKGTVYAVQSANIVNLTLTDI